MQVLLRPYLVWCVLFAISVKGFIFSLNKCNYPSTTFYQRNFPKFLQSTALSILSDDDILKVVSRTDRGTAVAKEDREIINKWFNESSKRYQSTNPSPLDDDLAYGNFDVSYVDGGKSQSGNPAGGKLFRGFIGRFLYRNEGLYQHLIREQTKTIAINYIKGKLFNLIPLAVILKGVITRLSDEDRMKYVNKYNNPLSSKGTCRADFDPPIVAFGNPNRNPFSIRVGPGSYVVLDTPYLSPKIRLGLGSKGSTFIFTRTNDPLADTWKQYLAVKPQKASELGLKLLTTAIITYFSSEYLLEQFTINPLLTTIIRKVCKFFSTLIGFIGLFLSVSRGGIEKDEFALDVSKGL